MSPLLVGALCFVGIALVIIFKKKDDSVESRIILEKRLMAQNDFSVDRSLPAGGHIFYFNDAANTVAISDGEIIKRRGYAEILRFKVLENGDIIAQGEAGNLTGTLFADSDEDSGQSCNQLQLQIEVNDPQNPQVVVNCIDKPTLKNAPEYIEARKQVQELVVELSEIQKTAIASSVH